MICVEQIGPFDIFIKSILQDPNRLSVAQKIIKKNLPEQDTAEDLVPAAAALSGQTIKPVQIPLKYPLLIGGMIKEISKIRDEKAKDRLIFQLRGMEIFFKENADKTNKKKIIAIKCSECNEYFEKKKLIIQGDIDTCDDCLCPM